jgi:ATP-dependent Clp protease protease subunit
MDQSIDIFDEAYLNFLGEINFQTVSNLINAFTQLINIHKVSNIHFMISSPGGSVDAGIALYNFLISLPCTLTTYNMGSIDSIANMVFIAGKERVAKPSSTFLFHGIKWSFVSGTQFALPQLQEIISKISKDEAKIAEIIASRSNIETKEIKKLFVRGESKDANFALTKGIVHEIKSFEIPSNTRFFNIT